ncbi:UPF0187-domain-containing protein [Cylindrobasidium torrendii FP15055 ss-10]|uniref:UPF0187-domain-containing protein n=1 Tax=Cylindrobasidium torrendii FP15055 ss-10 TaxID=1314674 RepID=A0A0D7BLV2_9AGAR|nr:UPF0187-domain-containing protein [Cylindrobasidium torrendii FP15055 ss-10]
MSNSRNKRSLTGRHALLPAIQPNGSVSPLARRQPYDLVAWTFGRGSVIWRIWPAVTFHTLFAALVVFLQMRSYLELGVPNVLLTVLGVCIGFVISYRASSGYDRYWTGRTYWSDVMKNTRAIGRLIWFHVPPVVSSRTPEEVASGQLNRSKEEMVKVMAEKRMALDLVKGFAVALKHHLRGEDGIYYEDLYHLIRPLHNHDHTEDQKINAAMSSAVQSPSRARQITTSPALRTSASVSSSSSHSASDRDPVIPPINAYGTFRPMTYTNPSTTSVGSGHRLQAAMPNSTTGKDVLSQVDSDLVPFGSVVTIIRNLFRKHEDEDEEDEEDEENLPGFGVGFKDPYNAYSSQRKWRGSETFTNAGVHHPRLDGHKRHPVVATQGDENLPLEILRCLSEWFSVLELRASVPGSSMGSMIGLLANMEDNLTALERILTTPLPFVYSVHIRHTLWIYLFALPFQLVTSFGWYAIPGVSIASFIYIGFLAAGEEIEQPFGYDENDLDMDMFCQQIIHPEIERLKQSPCLNAYMGDQEGKTTRASVVRRSSVVKRTTDGEDGGLI